MSEAAGAGEADPAGVTEPEAAGGDADAAGADADGATDALLLGASVGTGVGDGSGGRRPIASVLMSMNPLPCLTTIAWRPFALNTVATWSAVTFGSSNRICQVVPPV